MNPPTPPTPRAHSAWALLTELLYAAQTTAPSLTHPPHAVLRALRTPTPGPVERWWLTWTLTSPHPAPTAPTAPTTNHAHPTNTPLFPQGRAPGFDAPTAGGAPARPGPPPPAGYEPAPEATTPPHPNPDATPAATDVTTWVYATAGGWVVHPALVRAHAVRGRRLRNAWLLKLARALGGPFAQPAAYAAAPARAARRPRRAPHRFRPATVAQVRAAYAARAAPPRQTPPALSAPKAPGGPRGAAGAQAPGGGAAAHPGGAPLGQEGGLDVEGEYRWRGAEFLAEAFGVVAVGRLRLDPQRAWWLAAPCWWRVGDPDPHHDHDASPYAPPTFGRGGERGPLVDGSDPGALGRAVAKLLRGASGGTRKARLAAARGPAPTPTQEAP